MLQDNRLLAKCYLRLGQWQRSMSEALEELAVPEIVNSFRQATDVMPTRYASGSGCLWCAVVCCGGCGVLWCAECASACGAMVCCALLFPLYVSHLLTSP